jgi:hypothetical protein
MAKACRCTSLFSLILGMLPMLGHANLPSTTPYLNVLLSYQAQEDQDHPKSYNIEVLKIKNQNLQNKAQNDKAAETKAPQLFEILKISFW